MRMGHDLGYPHKYGVKIEYYSRYIDMELRTNKINKVLANLVLHCEHYL